MQSSASINLLKGRVNLLDEIVRWSLTIGRLLIIIVELVAFSAFIVRFSLDRTIIDLNDKIKQEQAIVANLESSEHQYRNLQERIALAKKTSVEGSRNVNLLSDVLSITPSEITLNSFSVENNIVTITANVTSFSSLTSFVDTLRKNPLISSVSIDGITNKSEEASLDVALSAQLKEGGIR